MCTDTQVVSLSAQKNGLVLDALDSQYCWDQLVVRVANSVVVMGVSYTTGSSPQ